MRKIVLISLIIIVMSILVYGLLIRNQMNKIGVLPDKELTVFDIIMIDSVGVGEKSVYWFGYDLGIRGYSNGKLAFAKSITTIEKDNIFLSSSYITGLEYNSNKNLLIIHTFKNPNGATNNKKQVIIKSLGFNIAFQADGNPQNSLEARLLRMNRNKKRLDLQKYQ